MSLDPFMIGFLLGAAWGATIGFLGGALWQSRVHLADLKANLEWTREHSRETNKLLSDMLDVWGVPPAPTPAGEAA